MARRPATLTESLTVRLGPDLARRCAALAATRGESLSELTRRLLVEGLPREN